MLRAVGHVRRMHGGSQPQLLRCREASGGDGYYVVKFLENPQHRRVLVNEWVASRLASLLGLPVPRTEVIEVRADLLEHSVDLVIELPRGRTRLRPGQQLGSRYPGDPREVTVYDFLPDDLLEELENLNDFLGMLVFDKWTCNTNGRQVIFYRPPGSLRYRGLMIDQGFCFNASEWNFPDAPLRGLYPRTCVYQAVTGLASFEPWLERLEHRLSESELERISSGMPSEWYDGERDSLYQLLERLWHRRRRVRDLIVSSKDTYRRPFPNWM